MAGPFQQGFSEPHRGVVVLVLGILGLSVCALCAPIAWYFAKQDLPKMDAGVMDPSGRQFTSIGKILGIVGTVLLGVSLVVVCLSVVVQVLIVGSRSY
jgi:hypothetical protein